MSNYIKKRVLIEAGSTMGWGKFTGVNGLNMGVDKFAISASQTDIIKKFGFAPEKILQLVVSHFKIINL